ncbi:MAG: hypothetical protein CMO97_06120 [Woeseia sp.]|nr:hypothetical protein [Woeseia sp.]
MADRKWLDNAFWETPRKHILNCISEEDVGGKVRRSVHKLDKFDSDGTENQLFRECVDFLGIEAIDASTARRYETKAKEAEVVKQKRIEESNSKKLEKLFEYKLETFEIPEIKQSKNRALKSKLRRSKSIPEVNLYAIMLVKETIENAEQE